ncbi:MAG: helix-turn-helix transcriptional regulator [Nannocystaceae bacterium]
MTDAVPIRWATVDELVLRIHGDLDREWTLESMAAVAGYQAHHLAHAFAEVTGHPPIRYVRLLRLDRAAHALGRDPEASVIDVALQAGFSSPEAFTRAFRRAFGRAPSQARGGPTTPPTDPPPGLAPEPTLGIQGPFAAWSAIVPSFAPEEVFAGFSELLSRCPTTGPWQVGGLAQPWGFSSAGVAIEEKRCLRLLDRPRPAPPPLHAWRLPALHSLCYAYEGPLAGVEAACLWITGHAIPARGLSPAFTPLISLVEDLAAPVVRARLVIAVDPGDSGDLAV